MWEKVNNYIHKILRFFRVTDENGLVSLTNIFIMIVLWKVAIAPTLDLKDIATVFIAFSNYIYKKHLLTKGKTEEE